MSTLEPSVVVLFLNLRSGASAGVGSSSGGIAIVRQPTTSTTKNPACASRELGRPDGPRRGRGAVAFPGRCDPRRTRRVTKPSTLCEETPRFPPERKSAAVLTTVASREATVVRGSSIALLFMSGRVPTARPPTSLPFEQNSAMPRSSAPTTLDARSRPAANLRSIPVTSESSSLLRIAPTQASGSGVARLPLLRSALAQQAGAFIAELGRVVGLPGEANAHRALAGREPAVVLLDTFEVAGGFEDWLREEFVPALPAGALVVVAGRNGPGEAWRRDPGWGDLLRVVSLRNFGPDDARAFLRGADVGEDQQGWMVELSHGHPLALSVLVEVLSQRQAGAGGERLELDAAPDVVGKLVESFVAGVPSPRHRLALECAAHARLTTAGLLRSVFGDREGEELFSWLRGLSFMEYGRYGLFPHDLAREVIDADLRWRDPAAYRSERETGPVLALSQAEFVDAVRRALRDLHRPDALATNPLVRTRLVREREADLPEALRELLHEAVDALRADPRGAKLVSALERTYLRPATTQEAAAELLDLPFSTYRRHLTRGLERVVEWLWHSRAVRCRTRQPGTGRAQLSRNSAEVRLVSRQPLGRSCAATH